MTVWTDERRQRVADMLGEGLTFQDIASTFKTSRSAVAGLVFRTRTLRLLTRPHGTKPADRPRKIAVKKTPPPPPPKPLPPLSQLAPKQPAPRRLGLLELGRSDCRFPIEDDPDVIGKLRFCGAPTIDTYCAFHAAVAFAGKGKGYDG